MLPAHPGGHRPGLHQQRQQQPNILPVASQAWKKQCANMCFCACLCNQREGDTENNAWGTEVKPILHRAVGSGRAVRVANDLRLRNCNLTNS